VSASIPLTSAVTSGDEKAVLAALANGADVNERGSGGRTALILAVIYSHTNLVRLLVEWGADPHQRDNLGLNAIEWAQRRGLTEALAVLTSAPRISTPPKRITINLEQPETPEPPAAAETRESVSDAERSRRWIAGFKQRLDEQELRRLTGNDPPPPPQPVLSEPEAEPEPAPAPEPPKPEITPVHSSRILTAPSPAEPVKRKRCPQCNEVYNGELVSYCSHHIVRLVDLDEPVNPEPPPKSNSPLFWAMVIVTLIGSIIMGSLITAYVYKSSQATARTTAEPQRVVQKGLPELKGELAGKAVFLPEAECPLRGPEPVSGTVTVYILVDRNGQVYKARGLGGDWLMRGAATEAAMKSTFAPEKLRGRESEGTITYTFKP
jgi:outer membrane biosynthesis protein TonB